MPGRDARQIELDGGVAPVDAIVQRRKGRDAGAVGLLVEFDDALEHHLDRLADADDLARRIGERQRRVVETVGSSALASAASASGVAGAAKLATVVSTRRWTRPASGTPENDQRDVEGDMGVDDLQRREAPSAWSGGDSRTRPASASIEPAPRSTRLPKGTVRAPGGRCATAWPRSARRRDWPPAP
jgi:hypothetical protein